MSARYFEPARFPAGVAPSVLTPLYPDGQTFTFGALLVLSSGKVIECSADPASVYGVALQPANTGPGFLPADSPTVITGRIQEVSVAMADRQNFFSGRMVNGATDPVTPAVTDIGVKYGVVKTSDGTWAVDQTDTTNLVVQIEDIDIPLKVVFFRFLEAVLNVP